VSSFEETGGAQSPMAHDRSLALFCDRFEVIAHFLSLIADLPPRRLLFLYGLGGNGRSLLLPMIFRLHLPTALWRPRRPDPIFRRHADVTWV
jgi:hypothetical protein